MECVRVAGTHTSPTCWSRRTWPRIPTPTDSPQRTRATPRAYKSARHVDSGPSSATHPRTVGQCALCIALCACTARGPQLAPKGQPRTGSSARPWAGHRGQMGAVGCIIVCGKNTELAALNCATAGAALASGCCCGHSTATGKFRHPVCSTSWPLRSPICACRYYSLFAMSGHWFHSARHEQAELHTTRLQRAVCGLVQPVHAARHGASRRNSQKTALVPRPRASSSRWRAPSSCCKTRLRLQREVGRGRSPAATATTAPELRPGHASRPRSRRRCRNAKTQRAVSITHARRTHSARTRRGAPPRALGAPNA